MRLFSRTKNSPETNLPELTAELFYQNEIKTNHLVSVALLIMGVVSVFLSMHDMLGKLLLGNMLCAWFFLFSGLVGISEYAISRKTHCRPFWLKRLILLAAMLMSGVNFFFFPLYASFLAYGPILISALYFNTKVTRRTALACWIPYTFLLWANVLFELRGNIMPHFHSLQGLKLWADPKEVFISYYLPNTIYFLITGILCNGISRRGKSLVTNEARITAEAAETEMQMKAAADIQRSSLPAMSFRTDGGELAIHAFMRPAKHVGGDFYDYFLRGDNLFFLVADVADKGLSSAMFMMKAKSTIRSAVQGNDTLEEALADAEAVLCADNDKSVFVTLWIGCLNRHTGVGRFVSCGHQPPLLRRADGTLERLESEPELPLGIFPETKRTSYPLRIRAGDSLLLFTDGLIDAENTRGERFGEARLIRELELLPAKTSGVCEAAVRAADTFSAGASPFDDLTVMSVTAGTIHPHEEKTLCLPADENASGCVIDEANVLLRTVGCPETVRQNVDVALDEVCTNIAEYAYPEGGGTFSVLMRVSESGASFVFSDRGLSFDPLSPANPMPEEPQVGGYGLMLVKNIMDEASYVRKNEENRLTLRKSWKE